MNPTPETPLHSWKEIGAYLQRDATTARRWEKEEGLPVHRHTHKARSSVYAYPSQIDAWRELRKALPEAPEPLPLWKSLIAPPRRLAFGATMLLSLVMVGNGLRTWPVEASQRTLCAENCPDLWDGTLTKDRRQILEQQNGDLVLRNLLTGRIQPLKLGSATPGSKGMALYGTLSPDNRQIAYVWITSDELVELRIVANKPGAQPRTLFDQFRFVKALLWAPDGKRVLAELASKDGDDELAWITVADGKVQRLKSFGKENKEEWTFAISPDGRFIAYAAFPRQPALAGGAKSQQIHVLDSAGSSETDLIRTAGINAFPLWTPDGSHLLFLSDRTGQNSLWSVRMNNGKVIGDESLVKANVGNIIPRVVTEAGSYIYRTASSPVVATSIVAMDAGGNHIAGSAPRILESFVGIYPVWSPDGKKMAFTRQQVSGDDYNMVVRDLEKGEERVYPQEGLRTAPARWIPDGKGLIKNGELKGPDLAALYRLDLETGEYSTIAKYGANFWGPESEISRDGRTAYLAGRDPQTGAASRLVAVDVATGTPRTIFTSPVGGNLVRFGLNPAGSRFLVRVDASGRGGRTTYLGSVAVDGTDYREIYRTDAQVTGLAWTSDGNGVLFASHDVGSKKWRVVRVPATGGQPVPTGLDVESDDARVLLSLNSDGTRLAVSTRRVLWNIEALDNVTRNLK